MEGAAGKALSAEDKQRAIAFTRTKVRTLLAKASPAAQEFKQNMDNMFSGGNRFGIKFQPRVAPPAAAPTKYTKEDLRYAKKYLGTDDPKWLEKNTFRFGNRLATRAPGGAPGDDDAMEVDDAPPPLLDIQIVKEGQHVTVKDQNGDLINGVLKRKEGEFAYIIPDGETDGRKAKKFRLDDIVNEDPNKVTPEKAPKDGSNSSDDETHNGMDDQYDDPGEVSNLRKYLKSKNIEHLLDTTKDEDEDQEKARHVELLNILSDKYEEMSDKLATYEYNDQLRKKRADEMGDPTVAGGAPEWFVRGLKNCALQKRGPDGTIQDDVEYPDTSTRTNFWPDQPIFDALHYDENAKTFVGDPKEISNIHENLQNNLYKSWEHTIKLEE